MVEADLKDRHSSNIFTVEIHLNAEPNNCTGLSSDERIIEEAVLVNELVLMSRMLACLIKFDVTIT